MTEAPQLDLAAFGEELLGQQTASTRRPLPEPTRPRFQPLRAGILNIWQYEDQELRFHDGRLILRGENGSGKSKALEVLLPFLLDADLSPYRLDPFQGQGRSMRWNLLEGGRHESRVGYVWLELGRRQPAVEGDDPESGEQVYLTLGCGLRASRRASGVDAWYFMTTERIGCGLALVNSNRQPLTRKPLRAALGENGTVFQNAGEYRAAVDQRLFDLGADRFAALRHLLLQLRRPHLSEKLDPGRLSDLLGKSLPPIEEDLIAELAELFERLAHHEKELARLRSATEVIEAFLAVYREYCRGIASGRSAEMRRSDSRYHAKAEQLRSTAAESRAIGEKLQDLEQRQREAGENLDRVRGEIRALEQSEAMKAAQALAEREKHTHTLEHQAEREERDGTRLAAEADSSEQELSGARSEAAKRAEKLIEPERRAAASAARIGLEAVHDGAHSKLALDAVAHDEHARGSVRAAVAERREAAEELRALDVQRQRAEELFRHAEERRREADEQVRAAHERESEADARAKEEAEDLEDALTIWADASRQLDLADPELEQLYEAIQPPQEGDRRPDLQATLTTLITRRRDSLVSERTALAGRLADSAAERAATAQERARVAAARELGPEPPRTRGARQEGRPGAPFYLLCDFAESLDSTERAGLEAALEAAGLLDAWVSPDGRLLDPEALDTVLVPPPAADAVTSRTLADVLVATGESEEVARGVVEQLLAAVAIGMDSGATAAVDTDGRFRLGPLQGRWTKPAAEHLGAGAREAARQRRLAELDTQLAEQAARLAELEAQDRKLASRLDRLAAEAEDAPSTAELERRRHVATAATADLVRRREELTEAESTVAAARRERDSARARLQARAGELRLAAWIRDLENYSELVRDYQLLFEDLARVHLAACQAARAAERAEGRAAEARTLSDEASRRADRSRSAARSARAEVAALTATIGAETRQIIERHRLVVRRREELEASREALRDNVMESRERRAVIEERRCHHETELATLDDQRQLATTGMRRLVELGFLALVLAEPDVPEAPDERPWSLSRALEIARALVKNTSAIDLSAEATDRRTNKLMPRYRELDGEIGVDFQSRLERQDDLLVFRVSHQQRDLDGPEFLAVLRREVAERESELAEDERELMRRILLGDVGDHLRSRLRQAHDLVREMNRLLVACPTASGMTLRLSWRPDEDADPKVRKVLELLLRDPELLGDSERRTIEAFFQGRVDAARQEHVLVPWREHLLDALDYRHWHRFHIDRRMPGESTWNKLTQRGHAASSGGEKAVALHLPLFAAAAAHYRSARDEAPKLILLDEAFAGIDPGMRGRCMALLVQFDLDFMMTSYDEWGCYEELPGVATYQLYRDPTVGGVEAIRFVWNGQRLIEEEAP